MDYCRITSIEDPLFKQMHQLMQAVFPPEEVLEFHLWKEPLQDPGIRVFAAVHEGKVVGATEYRYYEDLNAAMTDFTIIGQAGLGIGRFLAKKRMEDLKAVTGLDLCFLPADEHLSELKTDLIVKFLKRYYSVIPNKPMSWYEMIEQLEKKDSVPLLPI